MSEAKKRKRKRKGKGKGCIIRILNNDQTTCTGQCMPSSFKYSNVLILTGPEVVTFNYVFIDVIHCTENSRPPCRSKD